MSGNAAIRRIVLESTMMIAEGEAIEVLLASDLLECQLLNSISVRGLLDHRPEEEWLR